MIARLIVWSARNLLLVLFGSGFAAACGARLVVRPSDPAGAATRFAIVVGRS